MRITEPICASQTLQLAICFEIFVKMHSNPPFRASRNIVAFKGTGKQEDADYLMQEYIAGGMLIHQA